MGQDSWDCLRAVAWSVQVVEVLDGVTAAGAGDKKKAPERAGGGSGGVLKGGGLGGASVFQKKEEVGEETPLDRLASSAADTAK